MIARTWEEHEEQCLEVRKRKDIVCGKEGFGFWHSFGEIHHVYAFKFKKNGEILRLVSPPHKNPETFNPKPEGYITFLD